MADSGYHDNNQQFYRDVFDRAWSWDAYLDRSDPRHADRWQAALAHTHLSAAQTTLLGGFTRKINWLVLSGAWCGDCVRQGPIFRRIAEAAPSIDLRFVDRDQQPEVADLLRINGALKVPVAVWLSEDFYEVQRFGDRTLSIYRAKMAHEAGAACASGLVPPQADALAVEIGEWVDLIERVHLILRTAPLLRSRHGD
ncbi:MAG: thioredoxin family protein [Armatimonadetes bacterium]|nr:thioredoxin family protein [Armatimonadota bacterium]